MARHYMLFDGMLLLIYGCFDYLERKIACLRRTTIKMAHADFTFWDHAHKALDISASHQERHVAARNTAEPVYSSNQILVESLPEPASPEQMRD